MANRTSESRTGEGGGREASGMGRTEEVKPRGRGRSTGDGPGLGATSEAPRRRASTTKAKPRSKQPDLKKDLRDFASGRPQGWSHDDWLSFLESLGSRGHDITDREAIGLALEKERLDIALGRVKGVGPQKRQALVEKYGNVWNLRNADVDEIASVASVSRNVAERIKAEMY